MNIQPETLLYNFNDPERLRQIRRYLNRQKVKTRIVTAPEFLHPLGYLFEIPGFHPSSQFNLGSNFSDEMIVLKDFSSAQMDEMQAEKVILVVPKPYIKSYPKDRQNRIWTLGQFVDYVKKMEGLI